jgi:sugar lactone lactonase YvrE
MRKSAFLILILVSFSLTTAGMGQTITTIAGGGPNGLPAAVSNLREPQGVAVDNVGNVFVSTPNQIYKIDTSGQLTIYAGNGLNAAVGTGDGGPATQAVFAFAADIAVDSSGNLFVSDQLDCIVRRIDATTHVITTYAGPFNSQGAPAAPGGIAVDKQGNLFIPVALEGVVWRVDAKTRAISLFAGGGSSTPPVYPQSIPLSKANLGGAADVALDSYGNLFVADGLNFVIYRVDGGNRHVSTIVPVNVLQPWNTYGMATDEKGNLFIADHSNSEVRRWDASSQAITTVAGNGGFGFSGDGQIATQAQLNLPIAVDVFGSSTLYIADFGNNRIRAVDIRSGGQQTISTFAGNGTLGFSGDGFSATQASLFQPNAVLRDSAGNLFIADTANNVVRRVDAFTNVISTYAGNALNPLTGDIHDGGPATSGSLNLPEGVAIDIVGNVYIADTGDERIRVVDHLFHRINTIIGTGFFANDCSQTGLGTAIDLASPMGVASDYFGDLFILDQNFSDPCIRRMDAFTRNVTKYADSGSGYSLVSPAAIARDAAGNLYIADVSVIAKVDTRGRLTIVAGTPGVLGYAGDGGAATAAELFFPTGVAVDGNGNLYIADAGNNVIRKVDAKTQVISTIAGNSLAGFAGDGGPASNSQLSLPGGVFVDANGNIYIADTGNNRIRKISAH